MNSFHKTWRELFPTNTKVVISQKHDGEFVAHLFNNKGQCLCSADACSTPFSALEVLASKAGLKT